MPGSAILSLYVVGFVDFIVVLFWIYLFLSYISVNIIVHIYFFVVNTNFYRDAQLLNPYPQEIVRTARPSVTVFTPTCIYTVAPKTPRNIRRPPRSSHGVKNGTKRRTQQCRRGPGETTVNKSFHDVQQQRTTNCASDERPKAQERIQAGGAEGTTQHPAPPTLHGSPAMRGEAFDFSPTRGPKNHDGENLCD